MPALEVRDLVVRYGSVAAVDGVSFTVEEGTIVALLGPNGAGKTTTVEAAEGYRRPTSGSVTVLGLDPVGDRARLAPSVGVMLQEGGVYPGMAPLEALRLFASYYPNAERPSELLERVGLGAVAGTPWRRLSGGEQQRLSLGLALVGKPRVAFLDEPSSGMDPAARHRLWEVLGNLRDAGSAVLLTTHFLDEAEHLADDVVIIDRGKVVAQGAPDALMRGDGHSSEVRFAAPPGLDVASMAIAVGAVVVEDRAGEYVVRADPTPARIAAITAWLAERDLALGDLRAGRQSLEDVFLRLTGGSS